MLSCYLVLASCRLMLDSRDPYALESFPSEPPSGFNEGGVQIEKGPLWGQFVGGTATLLLASDKEFVFPTHPVSSFVFYGTFFFYPVCCDSCIGSACEPFSVLFIWINYLLFLKIIGLTDHWLIDFICFQASLFKLHLQKKKELHKSVWCVLQKKVQVHVDMWCRFPELAFLLHLLECDDEAVTVTWHGTFLYLRYSLWNTIMYWH